MRELRSSFIWKYVTQICPSKSKFNLYESLTASTLLHRLLLFIELGTVQTGTGKVDPARKLKCTTAASDLLFRKMFWTEFRVRNLWTRESYRNHLRKFNHWAADIKFNNAAPSSTSHYSLISTTSLLNIYCWFNCFSVFEPNI